MSLFYWALSIYQENSGNTRFPGRSTEQFPGLKWNFEKVVLFSRWKFSGEKACSIYEVSQGICATILNFGDKSIIEWNLCQMEHVLHSFLTHVSRQKCSVP